MKELIPCGDGFTLTVTRAALEDAGIDINFPIDIIFQQPHALTKKRATMKKAPIKKQASKAVVKKTTTSNRTSTDADIKAVIKRDFAALKKLADL
jgi:hypothetical protein